jgi:hypothetical protein
MQELWATPLVCAGPLDPLVDGSARAEGPARGPAADQGVRPTIHRFAGLLRVRGRG